MSSTNRGTRRAADDVYPTPSWCVQRFLEHVDLPGGLWLDPCAGDGAIIRAVRPLYPDVVWSAVEIRDECFGKLAYEVSGERVQLGDFLTIKLLEAPRVVIGNPPYSLAQEFVARAMEVSDVAAFLLRLNFLASAKRAAWGRESTPDVYVLPNRPSFTGGRTDSCEYAWFVWRRKELPRSSGSLTVLATTPREERLGES